MWNLLFLPLLVYLLFHLDYLFYLLSVDNYHLPSSASNILYHMVYPLLLWSFMLLPHLLLALWTSFMILASMWSHIHLQMHLMLLLPLIHIYDFFLLAIHLLMLPLSHIHSLLYNCFYYILLLLMYFHLVLSPHYNLLYFHLMWIM